MSVAAVPSSEPDLLARREALIGPLAHDKPLTPAHRDSRCALTGFPGRHYVETGFSERLREATAQGLQVALLVIDLDRFKGVNESLGHATGDKLLAETGRRIRSLAAPADLAARLGGDEFVLLLAAPDVAAVADARAQALLGSLSRPWQIDGAELRVTASVGISSCPEHARDVPTLLRQAEGALSRAKERGRNQAVCFEPQMQAEADARLSLETELRAAIDRCEFVTYFQPRFEVASGRLVGAEALVRWQHPTRGLLPPSHFIGACEDTGLIGPLGALVFEQAARQQRAWADAGLGLHVSVNLSPCQLADPHWVSRVARLVASTGCDPRLMEFEITESVLLDRCGQAVASLQSLRSLGFGITIDDFGTGYSNLAYLQAFPLSGLKIDRSFVTDSAVHPSARPITQLILALSSQLGLRVTAEGVETEEQLGWLRDHGCDEFQGFLASPPVTALQFESLARGHRHGRWLS